MKVRLRFSKTGPLKFIGHLDVMRYFQKLFRRANIPVSYSEGFSPHQILSFSHPLPLGMESTGEYADIVLSDSISTQDALRAIKEQSVSGISVMSFKMIPDKCENAMASVRASRYQVDFINGNPFENINVLIDEILSCPEILVNKKTKKSEKIENIRPLIFELKAVKENPLCLEMLISSGSVSNLKPELVIEALSQKSDTSIDMDTVKITRVDQYTLVNDSFVSLDDIGCEIE